MSDRVPTDQVGDCEGPLSAAECFAALSSMATGKAPGIHGFPMEFYLKFWGVLGVDLVEVLNFCQQTGFLAKSQRCESPSSHSLSGKGIALTLQLEAYHAS